MTRGGMSYRARVGDRERRRDLGHGCACYRHVDDARRTLTLYQLEAEEALQTEEVGRIRGFGRFAPGITNVSACFYRPVEGG